MSLVRSSVSPKRLILLRAFTLVFSIAAALLIFEGGVRLRQWLRYGSADNSLYATTVDATSGLTFATPGQTTSRISINSLGFRGPELETPKPTGRIRLAFIGASTTFCAEVSSNEMAWPHLVRNTLQRHWPNVSFDYVNSAVPG
jgi:hypothetical protein